MATVRKRTGPRMQTAMYFLPQINWIRRNPALQAWATILHLAD
jgi:hypothetical protein